MLSLDDDYTIIKRKSINIWNRIKSKSVSNGDYTILRSSLMSTFISILGKIDNENDNHTNLNNSKNVTDVTEFKSDTENNNNDNNNYNNINNNNSNHNWNLINVKNFRDFYNGNNENGLQDLLRLFQGLGLALGKERNYIKNKLSLEVSYLEDEIVFDMIVLDLTL